MTFSLLFPWSDTSWLSFLYDSPVLVAIITVLAVKGLDVLNDQLKFSGQNKKDLTSKLWDKISELEKRLEASDRQNDTYVLRMAEHTAQISSLQSQNAVQLTELVEVKRERDQLSKDLKDAGDWMHKLGLENEAAKRRIQSLEEEVKTLKEHKKEHK